MTDREYGIRRWLDEYLFNRIPEGDKDLAALAAGFLSHIEMQAYLQGVLMGIETDAVTSRERNARRWLSAYLQKKVPWDDMELAAIAAGYLTGPEARMYLRDVLDGHIKDAQPDGGEG